MTVYTSNAIAAIDSTNPSGSNRPACGSRLSGSNRWPATSATTTIGMLTRKTDPHQNCSQQEPAGDRAERQRPIPETARPDSDRLGALGPIGEHVRQDGQRRREHERGAQSHQRPGRRSAHRSSTRTPRATNRRRRRPNRAAGRACARNGPRAIPPPGATPQRRGCTRRRSTADHRYPHSGSRLTVGNATFTIVLSTTTRNNDRHRTSRISHRRRSRCPLGSMTLPLNEGAVASHRAPGLVDRVRVGRTGGGSEPPAAARRCTSPVV